MSSPFKIVGSLRVVESATVLCLRNTAPRTSVLRRERLLPTQSSPRTATDGEVDKIFEGLNEIDFSSGWEVLLGQSECTNWVRSQSIDQLKTMRYPGEYKFAGGNLEHGEDVFSAARRELEEEFLQPAGVALPKDAVIRPFNLKQTMPIQSKSNIMWNMVALADENPWLQDFNVDAANARLAERRHRFRDILTSGHFWTLDTAAREAVAPEVRELRWCPLSEAVFNSLSTMVAGGTACYVNEWQESEFKRLGIHRRDPMFMTACTLLEVEAFPDAKSLVDYCTERLSDEAGMHAERERIQWLLDGMTNEDFIAGGRDGRGEPPEMIKSAPTILQLREQRRNRASASGMPQARL